MVAASEASNVFEFGADWKKCTQSVFEAAKELDETTKKSIAKIIRSLFEITRELATAELQEKGRELQKEVRSRKQLKKNQKSEKSKK